MGFRCEFPVAEQPALLAVTLRICATMSAACGMRAGAAKGDKIRGQKRQRSAPCQARTGDLQIMRLTLYQLSQRSIITEQPPSHPRKRFSAPLRAKHALRSLPPHRRVAAHATDCLVALDGRSQASCLLHTPPRKKDVIPPRHRTKAAESFSTLPCLLRMLLSTTGVFGSGTYSRYTLRVGALDTRPILSRRRVQDVLRVRKSTDTPTTWFRRSAC